MSADNVGLQPLPDDFAATMRLSLTKNEETIAFAGDVVRRGLDSVYLVGCGGSLYAAMPAGWLLQQRAIGFDTQLMTANEFNYGRPARLGSRSLVVVVSHGGGTPETVAAIDTARSAGAAVLSVTQLPDSPLGSRADFTLNYLSPESDWEARHILLGQLAYGLLEATGVECDYAAIRTAYEALPDVFLEAIARQERESHEIADALKDEPLIYIAAAGPNTGAAHCLAMCYLQEMQWMNASAINAGDFFHGAFEMVTEKMPVIVFIGEDSTRPMGERVRTFVRKYSRRSFCIDSRELPLAGVPDHIRGEVSAIVLASLTSRLARHFAACRNHSLDRRRYMYKVEY